MKLRIKNDSLRLRLSQTEVDRFAETAEIEDRIAFGTGDDEALTYAIVRDAEASTLSASISNNRITVYIPAKDAEEWVSTKKVGFETVQDIGGGQLLTIIVEKDFKRLKPRTSDDVEDKFPHPRAES